MKKVTNITLGGFVFVIEDDAYEALSAYLSTIERKFSHSEDYTEIVMDIENAIAEKCRESGKDEKHAVTLDLVKHIIREMGNADDLSTEDTATQTKEKTSDSTHKDTVVPKRFYRDTDDVIIAGVASGIAKYFDIDPVVIRLLFVISLFFNGLGFVVYVILWLIVPRAETTVQKYAMRGERITLQEISEHVKKKLSEIDEAKITQAKGIWRTIHGFLENIFAFLGKSIHVLFQVVRLCLGFILLLAGAFSVAGLVSIVSILWLGENAWLTPEIGAVVSTLLSNTTGLILLFALFVFLFIPFLVLLLLGASLLAGKNLFSFSKVITLGVLWIIALTLAGSLTLVASPEIQNAFEKEGVRVQELNIPTHGLLR